eukprot:CAMPEP_0184292302 /NCGR_PEP_ID=MMETSP1049-20130417/4110_1 /TAXON_ID=77928 /ORGANISM="Proteomonas sulcata, Strain CCMP704" /LENGTH=30 /DNA_ID= /DNA_START= /DNA_END= /DNA_ORIENTATION=
MSLGSRVLRDGFRVMGYGARAQGPASGVSA